MTLQPVQYTTNKKHLIEHQFDRIKESQPFEKAGRMLPLLDYLVHLELDEKVDGFNQTTLAIDVFGKSADFDSVSDSIVRVEMGRLRNKLREYYDGAGKESPVLIEFPKGQYRPHFTFRRVIDSSFLPPLPPQKIHFCKTPDDVNIAYSVMGSGNELPIVKTSTWLTHLEIDYEQSTYRHVWSEFSRNRQLIRYDSRNMGLSQRNVANFSFDDMAIDLETVIDAAGIEKCVLFGTSQGVSVAVAYAAKHPERVSKLILLSGFLRGPKVAPEMWGEGFGEAFTSALKVGWQQPNSIFRNLVCQILIPDGTQEQYKLIDELQLASCDKDAVIKYDEFVQQTDVSEQASKIQTPTLLLHAKEDTLSALESHYAASIIPDSKLIILETANHILQPDEEAWDCYVEAVNEFI